MASHIDIRGFKKSVGAQECPSTTSYNNTVFIQPYNGLRYRLTHHSLTSLLNATKLNTQLAAYIAILTSWYPNH